MKNTLCTGILALALLVPGGAFGQVFDTLNKGQDPKDPDMKGLQRPTLPAPKADPAPWDVPKAPTEGLEDLRGNLFEGRGPGGAIPGTPDSYIPYPRPKGCCGPVGGNGPIGGDFFARVGMSIPLNPSILGKALDPGIMLQAGLRSLFYDTQRTSAWAVEFGIGTAWWDAGVERKAVLRDFPVTTQGPFGPQTDIVPRLTVTPSSLNQTWVQLALGQETYLYGNADSCNDEPAVRWGYDVGGRWGSAKLVLGEIQHLNDVVGGGYLALHGDMEIPYGCCIFVLGARSELAYMWSDILQRQTNANLFQLNLLANFGVRY